MSADTSAGRSLSGAEVWEDVNPKSILNPDGGMYSSRMSAMLS